MKQRPLFFRWLAYVGKRKGFLALAIGALLIGMGIDILLPRVVGFIIDNVLRPDTIAAGSISLWKIGRFTLVKALALILGGLTVLLLIRAVCNYVRTYLLTFIGEKIHLDVRQGLFDHLNKLPISYFDESHTGKLMARLTTDTDALWHLLFNGTIDVFGNILKIIIVLVVLATMNVHLFLFCIAVLPLLFYITFRTRKRAAAASRQQREAVSGIYSSLQEKISGIRLIRAFGRRDEEAKSFGEELRGLYNSNMFLVRTYSGLGEQSQLLTNLTTVLIICIGGMVVVQGNMSVGQLVAFYLYAGMMLTPLGSIIGSMTQYVTNAHIAMERIFGLMDTPVASELAGKNLPAPPLRGQVSMKNVTFAYRENERILDNLSFSVPAGTRVALVGPSGSGKSTIVNLICRFYYPTAGEILVDGHNIADFEVESYRSRISYVTQDPIFFSGGIRQNLLYAKPDATEAQLEVALRKTHSYDFVKRLPQGLDTEIGERGIMLSGGQKQRLSIARALLRDPSIVILDEPTAALDAESESIVMEAIEEIFKDRTCFIIAHRLSTIRSADIIFVLDKGDIVAQGKHDELLLQPGLYKDFCEKQTLATKRETSGAPDLSENA